MNHPENREELKFKLLQLASGHFLSAMIPDNWYDLSQEEQNEFLIENNWQPLEDYDIQFVWSCIKSAAQTTYDFVQDLTHQTITY